jgi:hypothetical protein
MKFLKILAFLLIICPSPTSAYSSCEIGQCTPTTLIRTITAFGATSGEAYANARAKIPKGYTEISSTIQKVGYKYLCYLKCEK